MPRASPMAFRPHRPGNHCLFLSRIPSWNHRFCSLEPQGFGTGKATSNCALCQRPAVPLLVSGQGTLPVECVAEFSTWLPTPFFAVRQVLARPSGIKRQSAAVEQLVRKLLGLYVFLQSKSAGALDKAFRHINSRSTFENQVYCIRASGRYVIDERSQVPRDCRGPLQSIRPATRLPRVMDDTRGIHSTLP